MNYEDMKTEELRAPLILAMRSNDRATVEKLKVIICERAKAMGINPSKVVVSKEALAEYKREVLDRK